MEMQNSEINDFLFDAGSWNPMRTKSKEPKKIETHDSMNPSILVFNSWLGCSAQFGSNKNVILWLRKNHWQKGRKKKIALSFHKIVSPIVASSISIRNWTRCSEIRCDFSSPAHELIKRYCKLFKLVHV